jgi:murein DD-endopeptidase MepM/ murein hydrolase activator NlpD
VEKKLPSWAWLNQVSTFVHKMGELASSLLQTRGVFHLGVLMLIVLVLSLRGVKPWNPPVSVNVTPPTAAPTQSSHVVESAPATVRSTEQPHSVTRGKAVVRAPAPLVQTLFESPLPHTAPADHLRGEIVAYTVQAGDSIAAIAARFGLQRETLIWSNEGLEADPGMLYIGQVLVILPVDGVYYTVQEGETLVEIATKLKVEVKAITACEYNELVEDGQNVAPGSKLVVPGGIKPFTASVVPFEPLPVAPEAPHSTGNFVWPVGGYITQGYWNLHRAIDIGGKQNDAVVAADAGTVVYAKWETSGYGNLVIVDHGNGYMSYYAHLYGFFVDVGDVVAQGQHLGVRGTTGRSTGPHLHFEIRKDGVHQNPLGLLPKH